MKRDTLKAATVTETGFALPFPLPRTALPELSWPAFPNSRDAIVLALQHQLDDSQWLTPEQHRQHQFCQLERLLAHAVATVPWYRQRLAGIARDGHRWLDLDTWQALPLLRRADVQEAGSALISEAIPPGHGQPFDISSSGSTGRSITVKGTGVTAVRFIANQLRYHRWHRRDFSANMAALVYLREVQRDAAEKNQGLPWNFTPDAGSMMFFDINAPVDKQFAWLREQNPTYLVTYPSNLRELLRLSHESGASIPNLKEVLTLSEVVDRPLRIACQAIWGVNLADAYSAQETGWIAIQCPERPEYHVQSESLLVEILDAGGAPCRPGEIGRVVLTDLHNFATPLIRYEIGDYAEPGPPCVCGRGLPVIRRVWGRARNLVTLPNGERHWPTLPLKFRADTRVRQFQLVQKSLTGMELKLVADRVLNPAEEEQVRRQIEGNLGYPFEVQFTYCDSIPRSAAGKYEDFRSEILESDSELVK
ncbi:MAG: phenylacetate--CoA ligase family protein [Gammaproteobacteria bacterium]